MSPDGRPYHKGVFSATRAHKLSTEAKDWREDRQFLGDPPSAFNNQVRKRALAHIKEVQADLKEQGQVEFEQRVQVERDALIKELWGQDAERARRTKIGQAMMHKIEQLARQSVRRQLNLESDFINVRDLGFAQVRQPRGAQERPAGWLCCAWTCGSPGLQDHLCRCKSRAGHQRGDGPAPPRARGAQGRRGARPGGPRGPAAAVAGAEGAQPGGGLPRPLAAVVWDE